MEYIEIENFLTIKKARFEIKKFNVLIGAQASGKSVIAKLVYFFKSYFPDVFMKSIGNEFPIKFFQENCLKEFLLVFPKYAWEGQRSVITYEVDKYRINILILDGQVKIEYCEALIEFHKLLSSCRDFIFDEMVGQKKYDNDDLFISGFNSYEYRWRTLLSKELEKKDFFYRQEAVFIPAGRSFFSIIQKNIFSLGAQNIFVDPLMYKFGSYYESVKNARLMAIRSGIFPDDDFAKALKKRLHGYFNSIILGDYLFDDNQDWIVEKDKKTNLVNASSGQQESLPMLLVLNKTAFFFKEKGLFFIEEPEAHLFPVSQKQIISMLGTIHHSLGHSFFITTHSPYILTAINNLIIGHDAYQKLTPDSAEYQELSKLIPMDETIKYEDVAAYSLQDGELISIMDDEVRLVGADIIDGVSDVFQEAFELANQIANGH